jgi:hypothetical protein
VAVVLKRTPPAVVATITIPSGMGAPFEESHRYRSASTLPWSTPPRTWRSNHPIDPRRFDPNRLGECRTVVDAS